MNLKITLQYLQEIAEDGDPKAFRQLYDYYFLRLLPFSLAIVHSREIAEEIVNDVFIKLWKQRKELDKIKNPDVYFYVAIKNKSLDYIRRNSNKKVTIDDINDSFIKIAVNPESIMESKELKVQIEDAINSLPPRCKVIFKLIKEDGLKYKEAAAVLDLSVKTIENQLSIATKKLAKALSLQAKI